MFRQKAIRCDAVENSACKKGAAHINRAETRNEKNFLINSVIFAMFVIQSGAEEAHGDGTSGAGSETVIFTG